MSDDLTILPLARAVCAAAAADGGVNADIAQPEQARTTDASAANGGLVDFSTKMFEVFERHAVERTRAEEARTREASVIGDIVNVIRNASQQPDQRPSNHHPGRQFNNRAYQDSLTEDQKQGLTWLGKKQKNREHRRKQRQSERAGKAASKQEPPGPGDKRHRSDSRGDNHPQAAPQASASSSDRQPALDRTSGLAGFLAAMPQARVAEVFDKEADDSSSEYNEPRRPVQGISEAKLPHSRWIQGTGPRSYK